MDYCLPHADPPYSWDTNPMDEDLSYLFFNQILLFLAWMPYNEGNDSSILFFFFNRTSRGLEI